MIAPVPLTDLFNPEDWVALLDVSLTGIHLVRPVYEPTGHAIVDFAIEYLNQAGQRMTGLGEQPGGTLLGRFPHALAEGIFHYYRRVFETGEQLTYETNYQADGLDNFFRFSARRSGAHLLVSFTDTSDQNRSVVEQALRESQTAERDARAEAERERALLQALLTQAPVAIGLFQGEEVRVTAANPLMAAIWGYTPAQVVGRPLVEGVPELRGQGFDDLLREVGRTQVPLSGTETPAVMRRDGELKTTYYNFVYQPLYNTAGEVLGVIDVAVDVTEQVLARQRVQALNEELTTLNQELWATNTALTDTQHELRQLNMELEARVFARTQALRHAQADTERQRHQLEAFLMQAPALLCVLSGPEFVFELVNPLYQQLFTGRQLLGLPLHEALPDMADTATAGILMQVYRTGQPYAATEQQLPIVRMLGGPVETRHFNLMYQARRNDQHEIDGLLIFATDVTEQVEARQQVQELNRQLAASNEELRATNRQLTHTNTDLDNFVYTASHDLRAPVANVQGLVQMLAALLPEVLRTDADIAPVLRHIQEALARLTRTLDLLTDVSRIQAEFTQAAIPVALAPVVEDVRRDLQPLLAQTAGELTLDLADCPALLFSEKNLRSLLFNLLSNALKYRHPDRPPRVRLSCAREGNWLRLRVQDNGLGLTAGQQTQLFGLFKRLHTHVEGTGVGLYMVRKMVENAGGTLTVESHVGVGATFTASFPC